MKSGVKSFAVFTTARRLKAYAVEKHFVENLRRSHRKLMPVSSHQETKIILYFFFIEYVTIVKNRILKIQSREIFETGCELIKKNKLFILYFCMSLI